MQSQKLVMRYIRIKPIRKIFLAMSRKKRAFDAAPIEVESEIVVTEDESAEATPKIQVHKSVHERWVEERAPTPEREVEVIRPEIDREGGSDEQQNALDKFLKEIEQEHSHTLTIERLPNWDKEGKSGINVARTFVARVSFGESDIMTYQMQIQNTYGGGHYQLVIRNERGQILGRWTEHIEPPSMPAKPAFAANPQTAWPMPYQQQPQQVDAEQVQSTVEIFKGFAQIDKIIKSIRGEAERPALPAGPPQPPDKDPEERKLDLILKLAGKNESLADKVIQKILGSDIETSAAPDSDVIALLNKILDALPTILSMFPAAQAQAPTILSMFPAPQAQAPVVLSGLPPGQPQPIQQHQIRVDNPGGNAAAPEPTDPGERAWKRVVRRMVEDCLDEAGIMPSVECLMDLMDRFPVYAQTIFILLNAKPEQVIEAFAAESPAAASLKSNPSALDWILSLQSQIKEDISSTPPEEKPDGTVNPAL